MTQLNYLQETASQTAGPYVHIGLAPNAAGFDIFENNFGNVLTTPQTQGERIRIEGRVLDGSGTPVRDVLLESWQANAQGRYNHPRDARAALPLDPNFRGWGRAVSDFKTGVWSFDTIKPGAVTEKNGKISAPHVKLWIVARGVNIGLHTRLYFADETAANAADPVLCGIEWEVRRQTMIAARDVHNGAPVYRLDIHLQGPTETVFFDV